MIQRSSTQRDDIPLKVLIVNCRLIIEIIPYWKTLMESTHADIVLGTESWLKPDHLSTAIFPKRYKVYRKDRLNKTCITPMKDNGRLLNASKDKADILNRQYQSVFAQEDPGPLIPDPDGDPFLAMKDITVKEQGVRKLLQKTNIRKASGPDMISVRLLKECAED